jgi:hypothetical protein
MKWIGFIKIIIVGLISFQSSATELKDFENKSTPIQDPFARGIVRSPAYGTENGRSKIEYHRLDDFRALDDPRYYRVASIIENLETSHLLIELHEEELRSINNGFSGFYITLGAYSNPKVGKQAGIDFMMNQSLNINHAVVMRSTSFKNKALYYLEYGPFKNDDLANATCYFLKNKQPALTCNNVSKRIVHEKELADKNNSATLALSQAGFNYYSQISAYSNDSKDNNMGFNPEDLKEISMEVSEGEPLGPNGFYIVRINRLGVHLANKFNEMALIPSNTFPVNGKSISSSNNTQPANPKTCPPGTPSAGC